MRFVRNGNRLLIPRLSKRIVRIVEEQLTYSHIRHLRGFEAKKANRNIEVIPTQCFEVVKDPSGVFPDQLVTAYGWYRRLYAAFKAAGFSIKFRDDTERARQLEDPCWDRLDDVSWRHRQKECVTKIAGSEGGLIICPTGYGKSFIIGQLCRLFPHARFDVTTHSRNVSEMIYEDLDEMLPSVGYVGGGKKIQGKRVMVYSGKSLHHSDKKADFLLTDEVQEFATEDYFSRIVGYRHARCFGFTANPPGDRPDNADFELEGAYGPVLFRLGYDEAVAHDCIVQIHVMWLDVIMDTNPAANCDDTAKLRHGFWRNRVRNEKIAAVANRFLEEGKQVLVMVDTIEHACFLKQLMPDFTLVYGEKGLVSREKERYVKWGLIDNDEPEMDTARRMLLTSQFEKGELRAAIATGVWSRGVNFKGLQVMIRADGKASPISDRQLPGRLSRIHDDKRYGILVDLKDQFDKSFANRARARRKRYQEMGWVQNDASDEGATRYRQEKAFRE